MSSLERDGVVGMTSYTEKHEFVSKEEIALLARVRNMVEKLPNFNFAVSCHMLSRAIAPLTGLKVKTGWFFTAGWNHSWLETSQGNIIDVYPWAQIGGPVLLCTKYFSPWKKIFLSVPAETMYEDPDVIGDPKKIERIRKTLEEMGL